jgi:hypothetical protein
MTSSAPLTEWALQVLRDAEPGQFLRLDAAALHDLEAARTMTPEERLAVLDALLLRAEALGPREPDREPIRCIDMRL